MLIQCGAASFSVFQFDGIHLCPFGAEWIIRFYGILLMLGAVAGGWLATRELKRRGLNTEMVWDLLVYLIIGGVIGARLWHVFTPTPASGLTTYYYLTNPLDILEIWKGGLGIPGVVIGGLIALYFYTRKYKEISFLDWTDIAAPCLALGQAIGRWGNFFNQELYGTPTNLPWGITITNPAARVAPYTDLAQYPLATTRFHPLFLYESLWDLANMFFLLFLYRRYSKKFLSGDLFLIYLIIYPVGRFLLEFIRADYPVIGGINPNQTLMAVVAVLSAAVLIWRHRPGAQASMSLAPSDVAVMKPQRSLLPADAERSSRGASSSKSSKPAARKAPAKKTATAKPAARKKSK